ncbi:hypothetical protein B0H11DRAFT_1914331 [Mycena galericulata]|nr:hypothetical protein B0H11DRAFT_1914331 [Mycena galericulata]
MRLPPALASFHARSALLALLTLPHASPSSPDRSATAAQVLPPRLTDFGLVGTLGISNRSRLVRSPEYDNAVKDPRSPGEFNSQHCIPNAASLTPFPTARIRLKASSPQKSCLHRKPGPPSIPRKSDANHVSVSPEFSIHCPPRTVSVPS